MRGHPAGVKDIRWREAIRDEVKATYPQAPFPAPPLKTKFEVEVTFRMTPEDLDKPACDLDNFVKPVLDTLFTSQNVSPRVTGVLLPVNDTWVFRLVLEKVGVETPQDQGADITVTSHPPGAPDLSTASASPSACESRSDSCVSLKPIGGGIRFSLRRTDHRASAGPGLTSAFLVGATGDTWGRACYAGCSASGGPRP